MAVEVAGFTKQGLEQQTIVELCPQLGKSRSTQTTNQPTDQHH